MCATRGGTFADTGLRYFNRNGRYRWIDCTGKDFEVFVTIEKEDHGTCIRGETELGARIPDIFAKSAAHYRALDAAATPRHPRQHDEP